MLIRKANKRRQSWRLTVGAQSGAGCFLASFSHCHIVLMRLFRFVLTNGHIAGFFSLCQSMVIADDRRQSVDSINQIH